ncbi:unnamed protein product [Rodentolepis nana]|uniref:Ig-like domain-containing protein n=1 Tax=Rodentolepis nana TaxID=102285 RepID=A0A0R3TC63_RODNA|nr:unnamed protein product [Rodentolepis nana]
MLYRFRIYPPLPLLLLLITCCLNGAANISTWTYPNSSKNYPSSSTFFQKDLALDRRKRSLSAPVDFSHPSPPLITPDLPPLLRFFDHTGAQVRCQATGNPRPTVKWLIASGFDGSTNGNTSEPLALGLSAFVRYVTITLFISVTFNNVIN